MIEATQQIVEAHIKKGGPANENPMRPSTAIADQVKTLQGQNLYSRGETLRPDNACPLQKAFGNRNQGRGPPRGGPLGGAPMLRPQIDVGGKVFLLLYPMDPFTHEIPSGSTFD